MTSHQRRAAAAFGAMLSAVASNATPVNAQAFPNKPIRIVTGGAGGGNDVLARLIGQGLTASWGQQVVVDNRPSGVIPGEITAKAAPDGYTLVLSGASFWVSPLFLDKPPYDPVRDFTPVMMPVTTPNILVISQALPVKSVRELIALAKARPGELNYGTPGSGSSPHLGAELFKAMAGVNIVRITYKSAGASIGEVIAGQIQMTFGNAASVSQHAKSGRLRALAVTSAEPSRLFPDLPTVAATGLPGYEMVSYFGIFGPPKLPAEIVGKLNAEIVRVISRAEVRDLLANAGIEVVGSTPAQLDAVVRSEVAKWGRLIRDAGLRSE
ncbi:MAG: tripartite tricarboxylate transporter substrate binding protein [Betaproteobacteria bacterium]|nr:tripartite tricarboxylate transporter substrate binding protein [Betaproteobacteria bacterium]